MGIFSRKQPAADPIPLAILDLLKLPNGGTRFAFLTEIEDDENSPFSNDQESHSGAAPVQQEQANGEQTETELPQTNGALPKPISIKAPSAKAGSVRTIHDFDLYKIEIVKKRLSKDQAKIFRGDGSLFATFRGQHVIFAASGAEIDRRNIVYHKSTFGARKTFDVSGEEYVFEESGKYRDKVLLYPTRKDKKHNKPLAVFELWPVSRTHRGQIRLYESPNEIDTLMELDDDGTVHPTRLLDVSIVAYFAYLSFKWNESLVAATQDPRRN